MPRVKERSGDRLRTTDYCPGLSTCPFLCSSPRRRSGEGGGHVLPAEREEHAVEAGVRSVREALRVPLRPRRAPHVHEREGVYGELRRCVYIMVTVGWGLGLIITTQLAEADVLV